MAATPQHAARVLGLDLQATLEDVRRVRKAMAFKYHPDRCADQDMSTRHMARINAAVDTLTAHIVSRAKRQKEHRARQARHQARNQARRPAEPAEAQEHKTAEGAKRAQAQDRSAAHNTAHEDKDRQPPGQAKAQPRKDHGLVRMATASYASVLARIGQEAAAPNVDVRVLNFRKVA